MNQASVASEPGVASTTRAVLAMNVFTDSEQSTQNQTESEDLTPNTKQRNGQHEAPGL